MSMSKEKFERICKGFGQGRAASLRGAAEMAKPENIAAMLANPEQGFRDFTRMDTQLRQSFREMRRSQFGDYTGDDRIESERLTDYIDSKLVPGYKELRNIFTQHQANWKSQITEAKEEEKPDEGLEFVESKRHRKQKDNVLEAASANKNKSYEQIQREELQRWQDSIEKTFGVESQSGVKAAYVVSRVLSLPFFMPDNVTGNMAYAVNCSENLIAYAFLLISKKYSPEEENKASDKEIDQAYNDLTKGDDPLGQQALDEFTNDPEIQRELKDVLDLTATPRLINLAGNMGPGSGS
jgi:hypothetical protein